jgi:hypothetical protein
MEEWRNLQENLLLCHMKLPDSKLRLRGEKLAPEV